MIKFRTRILCLFFVLPFVNLQAQNDKRWEYFVTPQLNFYVPLSSKARMYPTVGYEKDATPHFLVGGFGVGMAALRKLNAKTSVRVQGSLSRIVYWDEPGHVTDASDAVLGDILASSTDYSLGITGVVHYHFTTNFSVGIGGGVRVLLLNVYYLRQDHQYTYVDQSPQTVRNSMYKALMPTIPLEFTYRCNKVFYNLRYEQALLRKYNKDLADTKKDRYGVIMVEVGFRI